MATGFTFGTPASGAGGGGTGGFSFGTPSGGTGTGTTGAANTFGGFGGLSGGTAAPTAAPAATGFNFGAKPEAASTGFSFGAAQQPTQQASQPQAAQTTQTSGGGFAFGAPSGGSTGVGGLGTSGGGLTLGGSTPSAASPFGIKPAATTAAATGFQGFGATSFTTPSVTPAAPTGTGASLLGGLLGATPSAASATTTTAPAVPATTSTAAPASATTGFSFGTSLGTTSAPAAAATSAPPRQASTGFSFKTSTTQAQTTAAPTLSSLLFSPTTPASSAAATSLAAPATSSTTSLTGGAGPQKQMTFRQLEDTINKWTTELEEQEKYFLDQATQVNAWDRIVMENGEKIIQLNKDVEKVKLDQQKLDHELDFVHSQQRELEDLLTPLEKALDSMPPISYQQHADVEREHTYMLAESLDAQLKRMGQDLKEIIERLNSTNSKPDPNDPVQQITKILNAHVVSLMWVDRNSANLQRRVEEISKQMDIEKREQERNFRLAYSS